MVISLFGLHSRACVLRWEIIKVGCTYLGTRLSGRFEFVTICFYGLMFNMFHEFG